MAADPLVRALRKGDEESIRIELSQVSPKSNWPERIYGITSSEAHDLLATGGLYARLALSSHPNGRIREAAVWTLSPAGGPTLMALLNRANDWVPNVATIASQKAVAAIELASDDDLVDALPLVFSLTRQVRGQHGALIGRFLGEARRRTGLAARLRKRAGSGEQGLWAYRDFIGEDENFSNIVLDGLKNAPPVVQAAAAKKLSEDPDNSPLLLASRNPQIRRMGLVLASNEVREKFLDDPHAGVRNDARFFLGKRDFAAWYVQRLPRAGAVAGLGETGKRADAELLRPFFQDPSAEVRRRVIEAWANLLEAEAEPQLRAALRDPSSKVRRGAVESILRLPISIEPEEIMSLNLSRGSIWQLLDHTPRWSALLAVLNHLDRFPSSDEWLRRWANSPHLAAPRSSQAYEVAILLGAILRKIEPSTATLLRGAVTPWLR